VKRLAALIAGSVLLASCGSQSPASAVRSWVHSSSFVANSHQLRLDAHQAALALRNAHASARDLHTVCAVLSVDALAANASLPTPDEQLTNDLAAAYNALGNAANVCYDAGSSMHLRSRALGFLVAGVGGLASSALRASVVERG